MRIYMIEAYGGKLTNGEVHHFAVQADAADEAIVLVKESPRGQRFGHFDVVKIGNEIGADEPGIISEADGPYFRAF